MRDLEPVCPGHSALELVSGSPWNLVPGPGVPRQGPCPPPCPACPARCPDLPRADGAAQ